MDKLTAAAIEALRVEYCEHRTAGISWYRRNTITGNPNMTVDRANDCIIGLADVTPGMEPLAYAEALVASARRWCIDAADAWNVAHHT
jgi:hypothetical protein